MFDLFALFLSSFPPTGIVVIERKHVLDCQGFLTAYANFCRHCLISLSYDTLVMRSKTLPSLLQHNFHLPYFKIHDQSKVPPSIFHKKFSTPSFNFLRFCSPSPSVDLHFWRRPLWLRYVLWLRLVAVTVTLSQTTWTNLIWSDVTWRDVTWRDVT